MGLHRPCSVLIRVFKVGCLPRFESLDGCFESAQRYSSAARDSGASPTVPCPLWKLQMKLFHSFCNGRGPFWSSRLVAL